MSGSVGGFPAPAHHRRIRPRPRRRFRGHAFWLLLAGSASLVIASGFALGSFFLGGFSSVPAQSSAGGIPQAPPGVSYPRAGAEIVNTTNVPVAGSCTASNLGALNAPTVLTDASAIGVCMNTAAGGYTAGDTMYIMEVSWSTAAPVSTEYMVQVSYDVTPAGHNVSATSYVETSTAITGTESAVFALDLTQAGDTGVTQFSVLVTEL